MQATYFSLRTTAGFLLFTGAAFAWSPTITTTGVSPVTITDTSASPTTSVTYYSSTTVQVSWPACTFATCGWTADHYQVRAFRGSTEEKMQESSSASVSMTDLRAGTAYTFEIRACRYPTACVTHVDSTTSGSWTMDIEAWLLDGVSTADAFDTVTQVALSLPSTGGTSYFDDGNTLAYAFRYGSGADSSLEGKVRLAYNPCHTTDCQWYDNGIRFNLSTYDTTALSNLSDFRLADWNYGFIREHSSPTSIVINAFQLIPLFHEEVVRMIFEGEAPDGNNRLYAIDAVDRGYAGLDYSVTVDVCGLPAQQPDLKLTGSEDCQPTIVINRDVDPHSFGSGLSQIRQSKVGFPMNTGWRWKTDSTAFLVMTATSKEEGELTPTTEVTCPGAGGADGLYYALWNTSTEEFEVERDANGCPISLVDDAHGPVPVHLDDGRYKLYYEDFSAGDPQPFKEIFANAEETGYATVVDYDDWDTAAVDVDFFWPTGQLMIDDDESLLGDHTVLYLDDGANQVMYLNLGGGGTGSYGIGVATLQNP